MGDATAEDITRAFICILVVFILMAAYAWVGLYRLWSRHFHRKPVSGIHENIKLLGWLLLLASMIFCTIIIFWLLSWFLL